jgi:nucleoside diphosphate kinase
MTAAGAEHPWHGYVFMLLCPDAVARRLCCRIVDRFERAGYELTDCAVTQVAPDRLDAAFGEVVVAAGEVYRYRLLDRVFSFGPSVAVVLRAAAGPADPYAGLRAVKGTADPLQSKPGSVRWDFGAINELLGLVHTADSGEGSAREAAHLAPESGFSPDAPPAQAAGARDLLRLVDAGWPESRGYRATLSSHRARVLAACHRDLPRAGLEIARRALAEGELAAPGVGARIAEGIGGGRAHPASALLRADWRPGYACLDVAEMRRRLSALGLQNDPWEDVVLSTSAMFAPRLDDPADVVHTVPTTAPTAGNAV